jgi:hypothetical protein
MKMRYVIIIPIVLNIVAALLILGLNLLGANIPWTSQTQVGAVILVAVICFFCYLAS